MNLPLLLHDRVIRLRAVLVILALVFLLLLGLRLLWTRRTGNPFIPAVLVRLIPRPSPTSTPIPTPTPTPTPTPKPIPSGKQTFSVSSGKKTGPQFTKGVINPYDPARGGKQTVSVSISDTVPITSVTSTLTLDNGSKIESDMKLVEGTVTDGRWEATWQVVHPYLYTYNLLFIAKDSNDTSQVELTLR